MALTYLYDEGGEPLTPSHLITGCRELDKLDRRENCKFIGDSKSLKGWTRYLNLIL